MKVKEYGILGALVVLAVIVAVLVFGRSVKSEFVNPAATDAQPAAEK